MEIPFDQQTMIHATMMQSEEAKRRAARVANLAANSPKEHRCSCKLPSTKGLTLWRGRSNLASKKKNGFQLLRTAQFNSVHYNAEEVGTTIRNEMNRPKLIR